jgi:hypothetical protein
LFATPLPSDADSADHPRTAPFRRKTTLSAASRNRREDRMTARSRARKSLKRRKNAARLAASVKNARFSSPVLLLIGGDLVRLDSPWAIRPYANQ